MIQKLLAWVGAHPQLVTAVVTAGASFLAHYGFNASPTVVAAVASLVVAIVSALTSSASQIAALRKPSAK